jgi:hypothetical protein
LWCLRHFFVQTQELQGFPHESSINTMVNYDHYSIENRAQGLKIKIRDQSRMPSSWLVKTVLSFSTDQSQVMVYRQVTNLIWMTGDQSGIQSSWLVETDFGIQTDQSQRTVYILVSNLILINLKKMETSLERQAADWLKLTSVSKQTNDN